MSKGKDRFKDEVIGRPIADVIYRRVFGNSIITERERGSLLDKEHAIDINITFLNGMVLTGQEKFLSTTYNTVTVEYWQNPLTHEEGDWFKLASQFYFVGYFNEEKTAFRLWILLDWLEVVRATDKGIIMWKEQANSWSNARATFMYTPIHKIPVHCIIARG